MGNANTRISDCKHDLNLNGHALRFTGNKLAIVYAESGLDYIEIQNFRFGAFQYGLYHRDHIPILLIEIADLKFDFFINGYDLVPSVWRSRFNSYPGGASFTIVLPKNNQVVVERLFSFNPHFTAHLKSCLRQQWSYYHYESEVRKKVSELMEFLVTEEMFEASKLYQYSMEKYV